MYKEKTHVAVKDGYHAVSEQVIAKLIVQLETNGSCLIALGGPGGTGKSTFAQLLKDALPDADILRLDDYKTSRAFRAEQAVFGPHPDANKLTLLRTHLEHIKAGHSIEVPVYDRDSGESHSTTSYQPKRFNILDGEIATYAEFRDLIDCSIFIDSDWKTQLRTRVTRDVEERGYDKDKAIQTFLQSNLREFSTYGAPSKAWADIHLYCDSDYHHIIESVSDHLYQAHPSIFAKNYRPIQLMGLIVPVLTPFQENGEIDQRAFIRHLEFLAEKGVHRIMVNGTSGEFFSLLPEERKTLLKLARRYFPGMVISNVGGLGLAQNLREVEWSNELGADAVVALPPLYPSHLSEAGMIDYLTQLSDASESPFILYNFPAHTGNAITPAILKAVPHVALKDSGKNTALIGHTDRYFIGSAMQLVDAIQQGAAGFVAGTANVRPELYSAFERLVIEGDAASIAVMQQEILAYSAPFSAGGIPLLKQRLANLLPGYPTAVRSPLIES